MTTVSFLRSSPIGKQVLSRNPPVALENPEHGAQGNGTSWEVSWQYWGRAGKVKAMALGYLPRWPLQGGQRTRTVPATRVGLPGNEWELHASRIGSPWTRIRQHLIRVRRQCPATGAIVQPCGPPSGWSQWASGWAWPDPAWIRIAGLRRLPIVLVHIPAVPPADLAQCLAQCPRQHFAPEPARKFP